jgi:hypothetical protein
VAPIEFSLDIDDLGRLVSTLASPAGAALITGLNVKEAARDLEQAIESARGAGYGECVWQELDRDYRWMFRRRNERVTVAVMSCTGTATGWQYVFSAECDTESLAEQMRAELERLRRSGAV